METELQEGLKCIPAWTLNVESTQISRSFVAKNFVAAIEFFRKVAEVAEEANHHPDLHLTGYRDVKVGHGVILAYASVGFEATKVFLMVRHGSRDAALEPVASFLQVDLCTHAIGGLSKQDLIIAARIDAIPVDYSPKWLKQQEGSCHNNP